MFAAAGFPASGARRVGDDSTTLGTTLVFDSSDIYGELLDTMILRTEAVRDNPDLGRAIAGAAHAARGRADEAHRRV